MTIRRAGWAVILALCVTSCAPGTHRPEQTSPRIVAVFGDSQREIDYRITQARALGMHPRYVMVRTPAHTYHFSVYARLARDGNSLVVFAYRRVYVFAMTSVHVIYNGWNAPVQPNRLPRIDVPLTAPHAHDAIMPIALALDRVSDPWQINPAYRPWRPIPTRALHRKIERW